MQNELKFSLGFWDDKVGLTEAGEKQIYIIEEGKHRPIDLHYDIPEAKQVKLYTYNPEGIYCMPATKEEHRQYLAQMLAKATPGPWEVQYDNYGSPKVVAQLEEGKQAMICVDLYDEDYEPELDELMANAQIIAMARDMYDVLEKVDWYKLNKELYAAQAAWPGLGSLPSDLLALARKYNLTTKE